MADTATLGTPRFGSLSARWQGRDDRARDSHAWWRRASVGRKVCQTHFRRAIATVVVLTVTLRSQVSGQLEAGYGRLVTAGRRRLAHGIADRGCAPIQWPSSTDEAR